LDEAGVPFVLVVATKPELGMRGWSRFFRLVATDEARGPAVAEVILDTLGATRPGLLYEETETGNRVAAHVHEALSKRHEPEIPRRTFSRGECDEGDILALLDAEVDAVFFVGEHEDAATAAISVRHDRAPVPFLTDDGARTAAFIERAGPSAEGTIAVVPAAPLPLTPGFEQEFGARCGSPVVFAAEAFQAASLLVSLITELGADRAAITAALRQFDGNVAGRQVAFTHAGENRYPHFHAYRVSEGAWIPWRELPGELHVSNLSAKESR
jgi:branched-chain amino acid transport system substrate-binding protein